MHVDLKKILLSYVYASIMLLINAYYVQLLPAVVRIISL